VGATPVHRRCAVVHGRAAGYVEKTVEWGWSAGWSSNGATARWARALMTCSCGVSRRACQTGDMLAFSPPLIMDEAQIGDLFRTVAEGS
jgi:adenosylmethionine-8-amino-7-oxononanoate aminotransferase